LIVHRLLGAALGYNSHPGYSAEELEVVCKHCNDQKYKAKAVSDASSEMFFGFFIRVSF
jgi:exoribonuclease R